MNLRRRRNQYNSTDFFYTHNIPNYAYKNKYCSETRSYETGDFLVHLHLATRLSRIQ